LRPDSRAASLTHKRSARQPRSPIGRERGDRRAGQEGGRGPPAAALPPFISLPVAALPAFEGRYLNATNGATLTVAASGNGLTLSAPGEPTLELQPFEERRWRAVSSPENLAGRGGLIERMTIARGTSRIGYAREGFADATSTAVLPETDRSVRAPIAAPGTAADALPRAPARPWPAFRGANAGGVADGQGAVTDWDVASGRNSPHRPRRRLADDQVAA
jgi:hypothetical protein